MKIIKLLGIVAAVAAWLASCAETFPYHLFQNEKDTIPPAGTGIATD